MRRLIAILNLALAGTATALAAQPSDGERFNAWFDAGLEERLVRNPLLATRIGDPRYNDRISDTTTAAGRDDERRWTERHLEILRTFDRETLGHADSLSYDVLKCRLEVDLEGWTASIRMAGRLDGDECCCLVGHGCCSSGWLSLTLDD